MVSERALRKREKRLEEIVEHILLHNGPNENGMAHPKLKKVTLESLEKAIEIARRQGLHQDVSPLNFSNVRGIWQKQEYVNAISDLRIQELLDTKYDGDLFSLIVNTDGGELFKEYVKTQIGDREVRVSMMSPSKKFKENHFRFVSDYITRHGLEKEFWGLRSYHFKKSSKLSEQDIAELSDLRIQELLDTKYNGDLVSLMVNTTHEELFGEGVATQIGDREVRVSMETIGTKFANAKFKFLEDYHKRHELEFNLTPRIFAGPRSARERRIKGELSSSDLARIKREDGTYDTSVFGLRQFDSEDKEVVREMIVESTLDSLLETDIAFLGLETEQFGLLRQISENLNYDSARTTIIERDERVFNAMHSVQDHAINDDRTMLQDARIERGSIEDYVTSTDQKYNLIHLDFVGHLSPRKEKTIRALFANRVLEDESTLYITLANRPFDQGRAENAGYSRQQDESIRNIIQEAGKGYEIKELFAVPYNGGTNGKNGTDMLTIGYHLVRKAS